MTVKEAIDFLDSAIRFDTPVNKEFLKKLKELLKECNNDHS